MSDVQNSTDNSSNSEQTIQKSTASPSEIELLTTLVKSQQDQIANIQKNSADAQAEVLKSLAELKKQDANPVEHGTSKEEKPKVSDADDVGGAVKDDPSYAPDGDAQASIRAPADKPSKDDSIKVSKADEADETKKDEPKKEEAKSDEKKDDDMKKSDTGLTDMRKSVAPDGYEYEMIKAIRPSVQIMPNTPQHAPTGYQVIKSMYDGWGGKYPNFEESFIHGYNRLLKGEFGTGFPDGGN